MRTIIVSDISGHPETCLRLLEKIGFDRKENTLIFLGDVMDCGPDPCGAYIMARNFREEMKERFVYICGEHEQMFMDAELLKRGQIAGKVLWRQNGGKETAKSFNDRRISLGKTAVWLKENTRRWYEDDDFICVHADIRDEIVWNNMEDTFIWGGDAVTYNDYSGKLAVIGHAQQETPAYLDGYGGESRFHPSYGTWFELPKTGLIAMNTGHRAHPLDIMVAPLNIILTYGGQYVQNLACTRTSVEYITNYMQRINRQAVNQVTDGDNQLLCTTGLDDGIDDGVIIGLTILLFDTRFVHQLRNNVRIILRQNALNLATAVFDGYGTSDTYYLMQTPPVPFFQGR